MENNLSLHLKQFNDKVKVMNQSNSKQLILSAQEARDIQAELFEILNFLAVMARKHAAGNQDTDVTVKMDGGVF
jgi:hypothetical protein